MGNNIYKYIKYLLYVMMALGVAVLIYFLVMTLTQTAPSPDYPIGTVGSAKGAGVMLWYTYILVAIAILVAIIFPLINIVKNPKAAKTSLLGLVIMIVILGGSYLLGSTEPVVNSAGGYFTNPLTLRLSDMGLYAAYVMLFGAFLLIIGTEIWGAVRRK